MSNRIFVTGVSALTASGMTLEKTWENILAGKSGLAKATDNTGLDYSLVGQIKDYNPRKMLPDRKLLKVISRQDVLGIHATVKAIESSSIIAYRDSLADVEQFNDDTGVYVGSPGNKYAQQYDFIPLLAQSKGNMHVFAKKLFDIVHPMWLLRILPNNVLAYTGITYGFKGANHNITNHAVGGLQALQEAYFAIKSNLIKRAVVVAYDFGNEPQALLNYGKLGLLSQHDLKPFDKAHDGTVLAEGAAALVLESEESARERDADCLVEVMAGFSTTECEGVFSIENDATGLSCLLKKTLDENKLNPSDIGMVIAHGNGNIKSDSTEAKAIVDTFGENSLAVTSFKWSVGHTLAASGLIDSVLTVNALRDKTIPRIANFEQLATSNQGVDVSNQNRALDKPIALVINRGFASMNSTIVIKACDGH
jgi:3-oxoacyl-[acyl-carrier-protein] synthase I